MAERGASASPTAMIGRARALGRPAALRQGDVRARSSVEQPVSRIALVRLLQCLERLALGLVRLRRHLHAQAREQVATAVALQLRRAAAFDAQHLPVGGTGRDLQRDTAGGRRDLDLGAERGLVVVDGHIDDEVVAATLVELRRLDTRDDEEVACGCTAVAGLTLAL